MFERVLMGAAAILLGGCYANSDRFNDDAAKRYCEVQQDCGSTGEDVDDCTARIADDFSAKADRCDYEREAAKDCIAAFDELECNAGSTPPLPEVCGDVYVDCEDPEAN